MIAEKEFLVLARPNARKTELLGFDREKKAYVVRVAAPPERNKANIELVRFLSKLLGRKVRIVSGLAGKRKRIAAE